MKTIRTDDDQFANLPDYPFAPNYVQVDDNDGGQLRMHYLDEGQGNLVLCLHGQPSWSYLYRKMIPALVAGGCRVIAPDLIGFGRSDKPTQPIDYTYANHVAWLRSLVEQLDLNDITLFCQDWGGLIGLRVATEVPDRFARLVVANTGLPDAQQVPDDAVAEASDSMRAYYESLPVHASPAEMAMAMVQDTSGMGFLHWVKFAAESPGFNVGGILNMGGKLSPGEQAAYDAPFPSEEYLAGARQFPSLVPIIPDNPAVPDNRAAWKILEQWQKPCLTLFSDSDPVTAGGEVRFQTSVPGAQGQPHRTIKGAGHFLQEDAPEELTEAVLELIKVTTTG